MHKYRKTNHILAQVKWFHKLKKKFKCSKVEMEYSIKNPFFYNSLKSYKETDHHNWSHKFYHLDVYGETKDGKIYMVEIGECSTDKKNYLEALAKRHKKRYSNITVIFVSVSGNRQKRSKILS